MRPSLEMPSSPPSPGAPDAIISPPILSGPPELSDPPVARGLDRIRNLAGRAVLAAAITLGLAAGEAVGEHAPVAVAEAPYPDSDAQDCSGRYGIYSWCKSGTWISPRGYGYRNCTDWAAFRIQQLTGRNVPRGLGNARDWDANAARAGYLVDNTPNIGDIAVWDGGSMGHVEVVEDVHADGSVNTSGYNKRRDGTYGTQVRVRADHYIQIADSPPLGSDRPPAQPYPEATPPPSMYGQGDLYFIKSAGTPSGHVEVHSATKRTSYQDSDLHQITRFSSADAVNGTFQMVGRKLYFIKTAATGSGHVEIHTATEQSAYSQADLAVVTPFTIEDGANGTWQMADINHDLFEDLVFIKTAATASDRIEVFAAYGGSSGHFGSLSLAKPSAFRLGEAGNGQFQIQNADLVFIKIRATQSGMVEYFRAPIGGDFVSISEATPTAFNAAEHANGIFSSMDVNGDNGAELVFIKTNNIESGQVEVFAAAGQNYQQVILAKSTNIRAEQGGHGQFQVDNKE